MGDSPPRSFGDYVLVEPIGQGGMGLVFSARLKDSERLVALKLGPEWSSPDDHRLERFRREGEITAALRHPNIVPVHDAGVVAGRPFLAYQLVAGARTLGDVLPEWPLRRRVEALRDVARALGYAHQRGVVHRDVKPENVLVTEEGTVLLADFGLANAASLDRITQSQAMLGTPLYIAPELVTRGAGGTCPQTDVYALGVMLYEALVGEHPYADQGLEAVMNPEQRRISSPSRRSNTAPSALSAVCMRALQRAPERRFADGDALADALQAWLDGAQTNRNLPFALVGMAAVLVAGAVAVLTRSPQPQQEPDPRPPPGRSRAVATVPSRAAPTPSRRPRTPAQAAALRAARGQLEGSVALNAPAFLEHLQRLKGGLGADEPAAAALANGVTGLLLAKGCRWRTWGLPVLQALARTGARPTARRRAQTICEQMWLATQISDFPKQGIELGLRALVTMDVDIDAGSVVFDAPPPRPAPTLDPVKRYVQLRARLSRLKYPRSGWLYQDLLALGDETRLGPVTRARALSLGSRSVTDPQRAVAITRRARLLDPQSGHAHLALAHALLAAGQDRDLTEHTRAWARWRADHRGRVGAIEFEERLLHHSVRLLVKRGQHEEALACARAFGGGYKIPPQSYPLLLRRIRRAQAGKQTSGDTWWFGLGFVRPGPAGGGR